VASGRVVLGAPDRDEAYDAAVIFNAIHGAEVAGRLASVVRLLRPGGRLLVDDLFLGPDGLSAELGIDWLSHGGAALQTVEEVRGALERLGVRVEVLEVPGSAHARLVLAHREEAAG
jgi:SAM-dependent methyltransferase